MVYGMAILTTYGQNTKCTGYYTSSNLHLTYKLRQHTFFATGLIVNIHKTFIQKAFFGQPLLQLQKVLQLQRSFHQQNDRDMTTLISQHFSLNKIIAIYISLPLLYTNKPIYHFDLNHAPFQVFFHTIKTLLM